MVSPKTIVGDQYFAEPEIRHWYTFHGIRSFRIATHDTLAEPRRSSSEVVQASRSPSVSLSDGLSTDGASSERCQCERDDLLGNLGQKHVDIIWWKHPGGNRLWS
eukprot:12931281-Prorocentrum_lima.AAC.1